MTCINNDAPFIDMSSSSEPPIQRPLTDLPGQGLMDGIVLAMDALLAARKRLASIDPEWDQGHLFPKAIEALNAAPAAIRAMVPIMPGNSFTPTHRHIKTARDYEYIGGARIQSEVPLNDMDEVAVYLGRDGDLWARRQSEFNTSRFESLPEAPLPPEDPYIAELEAENSRLKDAVLNVIANRFDTYKARNGKQCSIEGDDGEKCWIVSFDDMSELEAAVSSDPATLTNEGTIPAAPVETPETWTDDELWQIVNEFDDRTSPEDYPEMVMLNEAEFRDFLDRGRAASQAIITQLHKELSCRDALIKDHLGKILHLENRIDDEAFRAETAEISRDHWKANHDQMVQRNAVLRQRPDLPVDRLPAIARYEAIIAAKEASAKDAKLSRDDWKRLAKALEAQFVDFNQLCQLTFAIQHNPNCPHKFLIRLPGKSGLIDLKPYRDQLGTRPHETGDAIGSGKTLHEAFVAALVAHAPGAST